MVRKFDLNIEKVLEHWTIAHAVRELIANALDEQALTNTAEPTLRKNESGQWVLRDFGRGIHYTHLTQNENQEKINHSHLVIGKFGVGLKDALATLDRHGAGITIRSRFGNMTIEKSSKHGFDELVTLHVLIEKADNEEFIGTEIILDNVQDASIKTAKNFFLKYSGEAVIEETKHGEIYEKTNGNSKIYVNGLCVAEEDNFLFSYNITNPSTKLLKALNRERSNVGRSAYSDRLKAILLACESSEFALALAEDLGNIQVGDAHDELQWIDVQVHATKILNAVDEVLFFSSNDMNDESNKFVRYAKEEGKRVVIVSSNLMDKVQDVKDISGAPINTVLNYAMEWTASFEFDFVDENKLKTSEKKIFSRKDEILNYFPRNKKVKEILVSETMRPNLMTGADANGAWDEANKRVIIKRSQLATLEKFTGTLIHELIHAHTGADDETIDFENELTNMLGRLGALLMEAKSKDGSTDSSNTPVA